MTARKRPEVKSWVHGGKENSWMGQLIFSAWDIHLTLIPHWPAKCRTIKGKIQVK